MTLSIYDKQYLSADDQKKMKEYGQNYSKDPTAYHQFAEDLRAKYGYSGGADGSGYTKVSPTAPQVTPYKSPYTDQINDVLSSIQSQKKFSYNPYADESYQAYLQQQQQLGQTAFNNQLGAVSATTGGRTNSWSQSVASQAQNAYNQQAAAAMPQFEQMAYNRYQDQNQQMYQKLDAIMQLDEQEYRRYQDQVEMDYKNFEIEYGQFKDAIDQKRTELADAYDRTKLQGYVSNEDAVILGVAPGTLSSEVARFKREKDFQLEQMDKELEQRKEMKAYEVAQEKQLINLRAANEKSVAKYKSTLSGEEKTTKPPSKNKLIAQARDIIQKKIEENGLEGSRNWLKANEIDIIEDIGREEYNQLKKYIDELAMEQE